MTALEIVELGWSTTMQDGGRPGLAAIGVPPSGALDARRRALVNRLVGNPEDAAVLETAGGLHARGRAAHASWRRLRSGSTRARRAGRRPRRRAGARAALGRTLAVRGGFDVGPVLGSASQDTALGPRPASALVAGSGCRSGPTPARRSSSIRRPSPTTRRSSCCGPGPGSTGSPPMRCGASWRRAGPSHRTSAASVSASTALHCGAPGRRRAAVGRADRRRRAGAARRATRRHAGRPPDHRRVPGRRRRRPRDARHRGPSAPGRHLCSRRRRDQPTTATPAGAGHR